MVRNKEKYHKNATRWRIVIGFGKGKEREIFVNNAKIYWREMSKRPPSLTFSRRAFGTQFINALLVIEFLLVLLITLAFVYRTNSCTESYYGLLRNLSSCHRVNIASNRTSKLQFKRIIFDDITRIKL